MILGQANRKKIAEETLKIITVDGKYISTSGKEVNISEQALQSVNNTKLYKSDYEMVIPFKSKTITTRFEVTKETTGEACRRLFEAGNNNIVALNFASAKNPGGGWLRGAKAQEEDLSLCSTLYASQISKPDYYASNRSCGSPLYTDDIIYSPNVPFIRDEYGVLLDNPFFVSIITSPAPNAGMMLDKTDQDNKDIADTLRRRMDKILSIASLNNHETIVLGAWGCGVFGNDPEQVSRCFMDNFNYSFNNIFKTVIFAIYDNSKDQFTYNSFHDEVEAYAYGIE
jgi:uncharacterized protein (TIGR02452 family)